jgi:hypothetical protein
MECVESDVKNLAFNILRNEPYSVGGVEVWRVSRQLDRIQRA